MRNMKSDQKTARADLPQVDDRSAGLGFGRGIAPAVALLLLSDSATAADQLDFDDDSGNIPEPSALALLAAGAVVGGAVKYIKNKGQKK